MRRLETTSLFMGLTLALTMAAQAGEWTTLFNGKDLNGWSKKGGEATYAVENGCLVGTTKPNTPNTFLCPDRQFSNFELTFEVKCDAKLNSGIQIRSICSESEVPDALEGKDREKMLKRTKGGSLSGPQVEIAANGNAAGVYFEGVGGWLLQPNKTLTQEAYKTDGWNRYRVVAKGTNIKVWINDTKISDGDDERSKCTKGFLGFQVHGVGGRTEPLKVRWRKIKIKEL